MSSLMREEFAPPGGLPRFDVDIAAPELGPWRAGNTGVEGFWHFTATAPGPHAVITALIHGNEIAGAIALIALLQSGLRPRRGALTLGFCNLAAFDRFDPLNPTASRFADEDMNRVWDQALLAQPAKSIEHARAQAILPLIARADALLDLHSMLWPSEPLVLCGPTARGAALAARMATPALAVADHGHVAGKRLIDYAQFADPDGRKTAVLVEAGQHWQHSTVSQMHDSISAFLAACGLIEASVAQGMRAPARLARVEQVITAETSGFAFLRAFRGGEVIGPAGTLIALDGAREIRTPFADCMLVMPSLKPSRGHTAVRLARFVGA